MPADNQRYRVRILTRSRVAHLRLRPGQVLWLTGDKLRVAAHLCRCGTARPADSRTRLDIEVFEALRNTRSDP